MQISGIYPYMGYHYKDKPRKGKKMRESFDRELNKYLEATSKEPFKACDCCGGNIFDYEYAYKAGDFYFCADCLTRLKASAQVIEPDEWR